MIDVGIRAKCELSVELNDITACHDIRSSKTITSIDANKYFVHKTVKEFVGSYLHMKKNHRSQVKN